MKRRVMKRRRRRKKKNFGLLDLDEKRTAT